MGKLKTLFVSALLAAALHPLAFAGWKTCEIGPSTGTALVLCSSGSAVSFAGVFLDSAPTVGDFAVCKDTAPTSFVSAFTTSEPQGTVAAPKIGYAVTAATATNTINAAFGQSPPGGDTAPGFVKTAFNGIACWVSRAGVYARALWQP